MNKTQEERERLATVVRSKNVVLQKIEEAKQLFLREGCEDDHEGSAFDCWMLDQFEALAMLAREKFEMGRFKKKK